MKYNSLKLAKEMIKPDYIKSILFNPTDFTQPGHLLQVVTISPQTKQRKHHHATQTEVFYVLEGECMIYINDQEFFAKPGDAFITDPGDTHNLWNKSNHPFRLAVFKIDLPTEDDTTWAEQ